MSYKALYRTYRPNTFDEIKGQNHITTTLKNIIKGNKVSHAYLFSGPRGTGKTSAAKVFANVLNCKDLSQELVPCGKCDYCLSAKTGSSLDVLEIDAASNNGVADIRELRENIKYAPSSSKYKVYIIDEVHMLSKGAFNALLKTLEEPPEHVIFILATTEPHKIPITIVSRTQRFNFRRVDETVVANHLIEVIGKEGMSFEKPAIKLIAKIANGGMRDALSIVDQVSAYTNGNVTLESISQVFGIISIENQINLINHAVAKQVEGLLQLSNAYIDGGADIQRLTMSLIEVVKDFIIYKKTGQFQLLSSISPEDIATLQLTIRQAYNMMDVFIELLGQLSRTEYPRQTFELAILKLTKTEIDLPDVRINKKTFAVSEPTTTPKAITKPITLEKEIIAEAANVDELFTTQELNQTNQDSDLIDTAEIEGTTEILADLLKKTVNAEDMEDIISTQEISIVPNESSKIEVEEETPKTDDLLSLFKTDNTEVIDLPVNRYSIAEIINLLVQTKPDLHLETKRKWPKILSYSTNPKYSKYVTLLDECKIISTGTTFILISSLKGEVIEALIDYVAEPTFTEFINIIFGQPLKVFPINKETFNKVKDRYSILSQSNNLPTPKPVELGVIKAKPATEAEKLGNDLFGDLFTV